MRNIKYIVSMLSVMLICSCAGTKKGDPSNDAITPAEPAATRLATKVCERLDSQLLYPFNMVMIGDSLLIVEEKNKTEDVFSLFAVANGEKICSFGNIGDGAGSFKFPRLLTELYRGNGQPTLLADHSELYRLDIDMKTSAVTPEVAFEFPVSLVPFNSVEQFTDKRVTVSTTSENQLTIYDAASGEVSHKNLFPEDLSGSFDPFGLCMQVYDAVYASNNATIAAGYRYWNAIDLYDTESGEVKRIHLQEYDKNFKGHNYKAANDLVKAPETEVYFTRLYPSADRFYALSWGANKEQLKAGTVNTTAHVFSWEGDYLEKIEFDRPVSALALDSDGSVRYAIGMSEDDLGVHIYEVVHQQ